MSLEAIIAVNQDIGRQAAKKGWKPYVPFNAEEVDRWPPFPMPNIGYHQPKGWEKSGDNWFIDKTGVGYESEPALTHRQFKSQLQDFVESHPGHGYAITEEGPFQLVVSAFRRCTEPK